MRPNYSGNTTHPDELTSGAAASSSVALQWVFPSPRTTPFSRAPKTVGRDDACDTTLPGHQTSRRHAELRMDGPVPVVRDLSSRNGVSVNGRSVTEAPLAVGDVVRLGEWVGVLAVFDGPAGGGFREIAPGWYGGALLDQVMSPVRRIAKTDLPVTIQGETGTGKEGAARAIHLWSERKGPLVAVNCAALPTTLAEAELFGYRKGAFTGAERPALGYFRAAHEGTLFLDEVLDLPLALQAKLLRVVETQEVIPLGETQSVRVDVRVVVATQEPLLGACEDKRFRSDLKARLDGLTVVLPPLRNRREDIVPLFAAFLRDLGGGVAPPLEPRLVEQLLLYDWPLNVRELVLLVRRLLALHSTEPMLKRAWLPDHILAAGPSASPPAKRAEHRATSDVDDFARLVEALRAHGGNVSKAAASLGIARSRAYRLLDARPEFDRSGLRKP